jgi:ABC-type uncharacterized transport system ATPase subunit
VIFITHKIAEVTDVADTVTVMKAGACIANLERPFTAAQVAGLMLGDEAPEVGATDIGVTAESPSPPPLRTESPALVATGIGLHEGSRTLLEDVTFSVRAGEVLGLTGVRQSGIEAIEEVLGGVLPPSSGSIVFGGRDLTGLSPRALRRHGVAYVPTDRLLRGASMDASVAENMIVLERRQLQRAGVFLPTEVRRYGRRLAREFEIDATLHAPLHRLSGGNIQKVILSRELGEHPRLLIICEPSWGLDIRSRQMIGRRIREAADDGAAVVLISTDMDEVLDFADTVGALYAGRLSKIVPVSEIDRQSLGHLVFGSGRPPEKTHA